MRIRRVLAIAILSLPCVFAWFACSEFVGEDPANGRPEGGDAPAVDSGAEPDADEPLPSFTDTKNWESYDLDSDAGFTGAAYDGTHVYFSPAVGQFARFDTGKSFADTSAWTTFDTMALPGSPRTFGPGVVANGFAYFPAWFGGPAGAISTTSLRLDLSQPFSSATSWSVLPTTSPSDDAGLAPFGGAFVSDRQVTFTPYAKAQGADRPAMSYVQPATNGSFELALSRVVPAAAVGLDGSEFVGAALVGDFVYAGDIVKQRFVKLKKSLDETATVFDSSQLNGSATPPASFGAVTDGRYVYFVPFGVAGNPFVAASRLIRFDTSKSFTDRTSYDVFDLAVLAGRPGGLCGGAFDGRFIYLGPAASTGAVRYDTTKEFGSQTSYDTFALPTPHCGAVFDGQFVYFAPFAAGRAAVRFRARATRKPWAPQASNL